MFNVPMTNSRLYQENSKVPFWTNEQSVDMFGELVHLLSPQGGTVCDPYDGTLTIEIACVRTGRKFFTSEQNNQCFEAAVRRLGRFLPSQQPSETISLGTTLHSMEEDFETESKVAADVLLKISKMSDDVSESFNPLSTAQHNTELSDNNDKNHKTYYKTGIDRQVGNPDPASIPIKYSSDCT